MAPLSLKIILDEGAVTRTVMFDSTTRVADVYHVIKEKVLNVDDSKEYGLFLTSADDDLSGVWLERHRALEYYMLRDGDSLLYLPRTRNLRVRMLDGSVKTLQVDESKNIGELMITICGKIGITNHDEYGLCQEESTELDELREQKGAGAGATGTLTMKRKKMEKDRDVKLEQMSKKLKTDDNVEWLDQHKTLRELGVDSKETLLLKRRLFFSDRNVDSRDPVQLNLLYVQTRDAILDGRHPVTENQALEFAAIQCQIHFGDFEEEKHKPGFIENLREYLPSQYEGSWGAEKKILKLYRQHRGLVQLEAKHLYTKTARDLPTYGVTFFLVKEKQKGKKKLVPRLLGINSESILRLDEVSKEILQTWPLTHVKSYRASKNELFTLDFGDYSEKEYSVKTNDALRIRDILEGYIDIIRRRLAAPPPAPPPDAGAVIHDDVQAARGNIMTHVVNAPGKAVTHSFVGPSRLLPFEQGSEMSHGTQMMTVQQIVVTNKGSVQQHVLKGEVSMRADMSLGLVKKLNRMNSNAVKIVTLLSDPTGDNLKQVRSILSTIEEEMPVVQNGVKEAAEKQKTEEERMKLLSELADLSRLVAGAAEHVQKEDVDVTRLEDEARRIADLTTQMYFSLDPGTRRRSTIIGNSRNSLIESERRAAGVRRASLCAGAAAAAHAADDALRTLDTPYEGPALSAQQVAAREAAAVDRLGRLNAAIALFLTAHADPKNIDYEAAINSMNTIKEILPELAADAKALSEAQQGVDRQGLLDDVRALCDAARTVCALTGCDDRQKLQECIDDYADVSGKLVYVFGGRNPRVNADKENEIVELAKDVGDSTTLLLVQARVLTEAVGSDPRAAAVDDAGVACADAAKDLLLCAAVTAPTIREPHCQSALTAAAETLSSSAQHLALTWKPLTESADRQQYGCELSNATIELAKSLDRLKSSYANLGDEEDMQVDGVDQAGPTPRLRFVNSVVAAKERLRTATEELDKPISAATLTEERLTELHESLSQKMGQTNAAVASLLKAKSNPQNIDYETAELAINTISEVAPDVIKDSKAIISTCHDDVARRVMLKDIRAWCDAIGDISDSAATDDRQGLDEAANKYAKASKKLSFVFSPRARKARDQLMMELFDSAHTRAMQLVADTDKMAAALQGASGARIRDLSSAVEGSARELRTTLAVTGQSLTEPRCRDAVLAGSSELSLAASALAAGAAALQDDETGCRVLAAKLQAQQAHVREHADELQRALVAIRHTLDEANTVEEPPETASQRLKRFQFISSASRAQEKAQEAEDLLDKVNSNVKPNEDQAKELENKLSRQLADINANVAALIHAKTDLNNPNYEEAQQALGNLAELMPDIIRDSKALSGVCDGATQRAMEADIRAWCAAIQAVCASAGGADVRDFVDSAQQFADSSDKLRFVFTPREAREKEKQVLQLSSSACEKAHEMAATAARGAGGPGQSGAGGPGGAELSGRGRALTDAATVLHTTAQLLAPSISEPSSQAAVISSGHSVSSRAQELVASAAASPTPAGPALAQCLRQQQRQLDATIDRIKVTCETEESPSKEAQRLQFIAGAAAAHDQLKALEGILDQPVSSMTLSQKQTKAVQDRLAHDVAEVNAAVASLVHAQSDTQDPDYVGAEHSLKTIIDVMPGIMEDTKALSSTCTDESTRQAQTEELRAWSGAVRALCGHAGGGDTLALTEATQKVIASTNKLKFVISSQKNPDRRHEVIRIVESLCAAGGRLAAAAGRAGAGGGLARGLRALRGTAQLTAPTIHEQPSQDALLSTADLLSKCAKDVVSEAQQSRDPNIKSLTEQLQIYQKDVETSLAELRNSCADIQNEKISAEAQKAQRLKFVSSAATAQNKVKENEKLLEKPSEVKLSELESKNVQEKLSKALAQVNTAMSELINARSDTQNPDYAAAEKSMETISELMPDIINDTRALSVSCKDEASRKAMLADTRAWCAAIQAVCASAGRDDAKELNEAALKLSDASQKLRFVFSARKNPVKEQQIMQLSNSACDKARQMATETRRAARAVPRGEGAALCRRAAALSDAADALHTTAQLTGASLHSPPCVSALLSAADSVSAWASALGRAAARARHPAARPLSEEVGRYSDVLEAALRGLRTAATADTKPTTKPRPAPPPVPQKTSTLSGRGAATAGAAGAGAVRVRVVSHSDGRRASQDWLDHMRRDSQREMEGVPDLHALRAKEEKRRKEEFAKIAEDADKKLHDAEQELMKVYDSKNIAPNLDVEQTEAVKKQMELKLAMAGNAASKLVASNHPDAFDYEAAQQSTVALSELTPDIVKDAVLLSNIRDVKARKGFFDKIVSLIKAVKRLVGTAKDDTKKLNEAAVEFADTSAVLLYAVSSDSDPAQEKEVIARAKAIGDSASRLALSGAQLAGAAGERARPLCGAARRAADAAGTLVYTAKLVAPFIHHQHCQNALITDSHNLSDRLKTFSLSWKPLSSDPEFTGQVSNMTAEAEHLENLLESFRHDLAAGKLVRKREVEKIVIEDTPLRRLATEIMNVAKMRADSPNVPESKKKIFNDYASALNDGIRGLDVANSRSKHAPQDLNKRNDLENAVQNLQITLLQSRPTLGDKPTNNIVDLNDFVKDTSREAESLYATVNKMKPTQDTKEVEKIKDECHKINLGAVKLLNPVNRQPEDDTSFDDILEVDQFGQDCENHLQNIKSATENVKDKNINEELQTASLPLTESCHLLRFATKSALATTQSVALDETLEDLLDFEKKLDKMLAPVDGARVSKEGANSGRLPLCRARLCGAGAAAARGAGGGAAPALLAYVTAARPRLGDSAQRNKFKEHVSRVVGLLQTITARSGARVALWQPVPDAGLIALTQKLNQELENSPFANEEPKKILNESDLNRLLMPADVKVEGNAKQLEEKLQQTATKLVSMCGTVQQSACRPESLRRAAPAAAAAAAELAAVALSLADKNPLHKKRTEQASQEMCWATYSFLRAAEAGAGEGGAAPRPLRAAAAVLADAVNKLTRACGSSNSLQGACGELSRALQAQQPSTQARAAAAPAAPAALPYDACLQTLASQKEVIQKLNKDEPMSREEFTQSLNFVTSAVCNSAEYAAQCTYLISISEEHKDMCKEGLVNVPLLQKQTSSVQESCFRIMRATDVELAKEEEVNMRKLTEKLNQALKEANGLTKDAAAKRELTESGFRVDLAAKALSSAIGDANASMDKITTCSLTLVDSVGALNDALERPGLLPAAGARSRESGAMADDVTTAASNLLTKAQALLREVKSAPDDDGPMTWVTYNTPRKNLLEAFEALLSSIKRNGEKSGLVEAAEVAEDETETPKKSHVEILEDTARKWLQRRPSRSEVLEAGVSAASDIINLAAEMSSDTKGQDREELNSLIAESRELLAECSKKYDNDTASVLIERLRELRKAVQRGAVTRVVEDFLGSETPLEDLDILVDAEADEAKRKFLLDKKIAELMAQLGRVKRTARFVGSAARGGGPQLDRCREQAELLAPMLVKAARERVASPNDKRAVENYRKLLAEYTEALCKVRDQCDLALDPLEFVQAAGETMSTLREESGDADAQRAAYTTRAITRLCARVIGVGMSSAAARDAGVRGALLAARDQLAAAPAADRASRLPDWKDSTAEILRTTGEVESALGGENIFKKLPEPDQPIYNAALTLHTAVRGWSGRDNEIVAVAKRMAVLMARLSDQMNTDRKRELIATSKSIVTESREVAALARKLATECTDVRIRTNLLQVCERIPTISGQLKMLTTVKGSSLGNQGGEEDREAMNMLVVNAQNLMSNVQEVVKAAVSASVKIASQRGLKWVQKKY